MPLSCVIGSGPAGVACATALQKKGIAVLMLDAGISLEPDREEMVHQMAGQQPAQWSAQSLAAIKEGMSAEAKGIPLKRIYGSDYPYREACEHLHCEMQKEQTVGLRPSFGFGGFSAVWGAALLPYTESDMKGWPFGNDRLCAHYAAVEEITGIAARRDDLNELFPIASPNPTRLEFSQQAAAFHAHLTRHRDGLRRAGMHFGASRLAVDAQPSHSPACAHCGLCMYGCPYGLIYNSAATVQKLAAQPGFEYRKDIAVERVAESQTHVQIFGKHRLTGEPFQMEADRAYLTAGVLPTTRILMESLGCYGHALPIKDSQYFLLPLLFPKRTKNVHLESLHTLSQLFLEISDPRVSPHLVHLQAYSYSDLIGQALRKSLGPLGKLDFFVRQFEGRLMIIQGYVHSDHSSQIFASLSDSGGKFTLKAESQQKPKTAIRRVIGKLLREAPRLGALALPPMLQVAPVGRGFHCGGSFPMREHPQAFESDVLGRPTGFKRVHIADASCFPSVPATTITMSAMANAHRIGWESADL